VLVIIWWWFNLLCRIHLEVCSESFSRNFKFAMDYPFEWWFLFLSVGNPNVSHRTNTNRYTHYYKFMVVLKSFFDGISRWKVVAVFHRVILRWSFLRENGNITRIHFCTWKLQKIFIQPIIRWLINFQSGLISSQEMVTMKKLTFTGILSNHF